METQRGGATGTAAAAALGLVALAALGALWSVDYLPTHDGPQHIFTAHAANHLGDAARGYARFVEPRVPLTNHGFAVLFGPLDRWLPWRTATRLALSGLLLTWCLGAFWLARTVEPRRAWLGVLLAGGAFQWSLYMGLFSFHFATGFGLLVLAVALAPPPHSRARRGAVAGLLLAQALLHVASAALTGLVLAAVEIARAGPGARARGLSRAVALGAPAALLALALAGAGLGAQLEAGGTAGAAGETAVDWSAERPPLWTLAGCFFAGPAWRAWPPTLAALAAPLAAGLLAWRQRSARPLRREDAALLASGTALLLAALLAPLHLQGWDFFSVRFVPLGVTCLLLAWPLERLPRGARGGLAAGLLAFALASTAWAWSHNCDLATRASDALAGLDAGLVRDGPRLPIVLDPYLGRSFADGDAPVPYAVPLLNLGQLYATEQGGFPPYTFALTWQLHPVVWRADARETYPQVVDRRYALELARRRALGGGPDDPALREAMTTFLAGVGTHYQDVILWGRPEDADLLERLGFVADYRRGGLLIARYGGCPLTLRFPADASPPAPVGVELGWLPAWHVTHRYHLDPGDARFRDASGDLRFPLEKPPCGGAWLRLVGGGDGDLRCEGSDAEGRLLVPAPRSTPVIDCRVDGGA